MSTSATLEILELADSENADQLKKHRQKVIRKRRGKSTLFVMPAFLLHMLVVGVPAMSLFYYSLTNWTGTGTPRFVGFENFKQMVTADDNFHHALINNLIYMTIFLTAPIAVGLLMSLLTVNAGRFQMLYRAFFFLRYVVSPVISGKIFMIYYDPYFGITSLFKKLGWDSLANIQFIGDKNIALFSVAFVDFWHWWGFVMVLFLAALHQVDKSLYEASALDGANRFQQFIHVTIPQIRPTLVTLLMITAISSFVTFDYIYVMTQGGPAGATEIASTWIYKQAFTLFNAGYGSALSLTVCGLSLVVYFFFRRIQKKGIDE